MVKKVLFVASIPGHFHAFHRPYLKWFFDHGYEVHTACNGVFEDPHVSKSWEVGIQRSPWSLSHLRSLVQLREIINANEYHIITCHTPMASFLTRIAACDARKNGTSLIYFAHGFHFFKGSGFFSWAVYYPIELFLSSMTDSIVCINSEDFNLISGARGFPVRCHLIPGIGVDKNRFYPVPDKEKSRIRNSLNLGLDDFVVIYAAEFIARKNHRMVIDAAYLVKAKINNLKIVFAGRGILLDEIRQYVSSCGLDDQVLFLGFVDKIEECFQAADLAVSSSTQEGLGLNIIEAMMCGVPAVATIDRGHNTIIDHKVDGYLVPQNNPQKMAEAIYNLYSDSKLRADFSIRAIQKSSKFELDKSLAAVADIYNLYTSD